MLDVRATGLFTDRYEVSRDGRDVTTVDIGWWREAGSFQLDGARYRIERQGRLSGAFTLETEGGRLASAEKPSAFVRRFEVTVRSDRYELVARSAFRRAFDLRRREAIVGSIEPASWFGRGAAADLPDELDVPVQVFLVWLALVLWRRQRRSS